jgi:hypothetical protein
MIVNRPVIIQSNVDFAKKSDVEGSTSIPAAVTFIRTAGYTTQGDGGGAVYKRAGSEPSHNGKIQDSGSVWWELAEAEVYNIKAFGAIGDDSTDNTDALKSAIDLVSERKGILHIPKGIFRARTTNKATLAGSLVIRGEGEGSVLDMTGRTTPFIAVGDYDLTIDGVKFYKGTDLIWGEATTDGGANKLRFINVHTKDVKRLFALQNTATAAPAELEIRGGYYDGQTSPFEYKTDSPGVDNTKVIGATFVNQIDECLLFVCRTNGTGSYQIVGNKFQDLHNSSTTGSSSDHDVHFLRCAGRRATIANNVFDNIVLDDPTNAVTSDTETIRGHCREMVVTGNVFRNCFMSEAAIATKSNENVLIANNYFQITDAYKTLYSGKTYSGIEGEGDCLNVIGNVFQGLNGKICDITGASALGTDTAVIKGNHIIDCPVSLVLDMNSSLGSVEFSGNTISGTDFPTNILTSEFGGDAGYRLTMRNNVLRATTGLFTGVISRDGIDIELVGNYFEPTTKLGTMLPVNTSTVIGTLTSRDNTWVNCTGFINQVVAWTYGTIKILNDHFDFSIASGDTTSRVLLGINVASGNTLRRDVRLLAKSSAGAGFNDVANVMTSNGSALSLVGSASLSNTTALATVTLTNGESSQAINLVSRNQSANDVRFLHKVSVEIA